MIYLKIDFVSVLTVVPPNRNTRTYLCPLFKKRGSISLEPGVPSIYLIRSLRFMGPKECLLLSHFRVEQVPT